MRQVAEISLAELRSMSERMYGDIVKGVVDIERGLMVVDAELHVDEEQFLLEAGSGQADLWGINLRPTDHGTDDFVEFDSMVNIRPSQRNLSRGVEDPAIRQLIIDLVNTIVTT